MHAALVLNLLKHDICLVKSVNNSFSIDPSTLSSLKFSTKLNSTQETVPLGNIVKITVLTECRTSWTSKRWSSLMITCLYISVPYTFYALGNIKSFCNVTVCVVSFNFHYCPGAFVLAHIFMPPYSILSPVPTKKGKFSRKV